MKINANLIRPGYVIEHNGRLWNVLKIQLIQPGKGGAFIAVEMRDVRTGTKTNERWRTADTVEKAQVDEHECTRSEEHTSELQSLMRLSYAVFCLKKKKKNLHA